MPSWSADIQAQINSVQNYQYETFSFLKYCETYIVGYSTKGIQVIKGKCHYAGIRDLGAEIISLEFGPVDDLQGIIDTHSPSDLQGIIDAHLPEDLGAYIRGFAYADLPASISILFSKNLPAEIGTHSPEDLGGYIKPWPQVDLPGSLHGWDTKDLGGVLNIIATIDLPAQIKTHSPRNIRAQIKGWVREATYDLGGLLYGYITDDLGATIRATEMAQLPAYLFPVQPVDLGGLIHGWDTKDIQGIINVVQYPWNLTASINVGDGVRNLPASVYVKAAIAVPRDLSAYILTTKGVQDLPALLSVKQARDLTAFIDTGKGLTDIGASIYPKTMRLTGIISVITMEHSDLSATISIPCFYSNLKDLAAYIRPVFQANLGAVIRPQGWIRGISNLGAKWGYDEHSIVQDKLEINIAVIGWDYKTEDKFTITASIFRAGLSLAASIVAYRPPVDLSAYINGVALTPYEFDNWKLREKVYSRNYTQQAMDYEDVDVSFKTIVKDYFYSSGSNIVAKVDKYQHFLTKVASYYSPAKARRLDQRLHKIKYLYDMRQFTDIDEAMKFAIKYVTEYPNTDISAYINGTGAFNNLTGIIIGKDKISTNTDLSSEITGEKLHTYNAILGYTDDGIGYLQF